MSEQHQKILRYIHENGGTGNVMEALGWGTSRFDEAFMIANEIQNLNYVKLLYSNFNKCLIVVELTLVGIAKSKQ